MRDLYSNIRPIMTLAAAVQSAAINGTAIDVKDSDGLVVVLSTGAIASAGDFGAKLQESDTGSSGWTDVAEEQVQTNAPDTLAADSVYRLGYLGWKRYVRLALTKAGGTSIAAGAVAILDPLAKPVA